MTRLGGLPLKPDIALAGFAQTIRSPAKAGGGRSEPDLAFQLRERIEYSYTSGRKMVDVARDNH